jgi:hypothetical protein
VLRAATAQENHYEPMNPFAEQQSDSAVIKMPFRCGLAPTPHGPKKLRCDPP